MVRYCGFRWVRAGIEGLSDNGHTCACHVSCLVDLGTRRAARQRRPSVPHDPAWRPNPDAGRHEVCRLRQCAQLHLSLTFAVSGGQQDVARCRSNRRIQSGRPIRQLRRHVGERFSGLPVSNSIRCRVSRPRPGRDRRCGHGTNARLEFDEPYLAQFKRSYAYTSVYLSSRDLYRRRRQTIFRLLQG